MRTALLWLILGLMVPLGAGRPARAEDLPVQDAAARVAAAKELFARYQALTEAFDLAVLDLYSDGARISTTRRYASRTKTKSELTGAQWKLLVKSKWEEAKLRGDKSSFAEMTYRVEEGSDRVRIDAKRTSGLGGYTVEHVMFVGRSSGGTWLILEERWEIRP